jgi:hypothetical protein
VFKFAHAVKAPAPPTRIRFTVSSHRVAVLADEGSESGSEEPSGLQRSHPTPVTVPASALLVPRSWQGAGFANAPASVRRLRAPSEPMGRGGICGRGHPTRSHQRRAALRQRSWNQQCATQGLAAARAAMPRHCNRPCTAGMKLTGGLFAEASAGPTPLRRKTPGPCISSALPCCWPHRAFRPPNRAAYPAHPSTRAESHPHDRPLPHAVTRPAGRSLTPPHLLTHMPPHTPAPV